jgi:WD40 repeat protein/tetratricopeptide (TPR) repeat protein
LAPPAAPGGARRAPGSSGSALLPGKAELSSIDSDYRHYFLSVARIGQQGAAALAYAHARGILHRDIKPSNLLLDEAGVVWITDFGLAKTDDDGLTHTGELVGTLRYMAPERFSGQCDARADLYGVGLTLYEMLVLRPAFESPDPLRVIDQIREHTLVSPRAVDRRVPRDLETIVLKATDKDPARRYATADELAEDLRRFIDDEPIRARRLSPRERLTRWCVRNPAVALLTMAVAGALLLGAAVATFFALQARENESQALREKADAEIARAEADRAREEAVAARRQERRNRYYMDMNLIGQAASQEGGIGLALDMLARWRPAAGEADHRGWEWYYLRGLDRKELRILSNHKSTVNAVSWSPDARQLASAGYADGTVRVWDVEAGQEMAVLRTGAPLVLTVSWSPAGRRVAYGDDRGKVVIWDPATGREVPTRKRHEGAVFAVAWNPEGRRLASAGQDRTVRIWDAETGAESLVLQGHTDKVLALSWNGAGDRLASAGADKTVRLWKADTGATLGALQGHTGEVCAVSWGNGEHLASGSDDQRILLWDTSNGMPRGSLQGHSQRITSLCWSRTGTELASASTDQEARLWHVYDGRYGWMSAVFRGHAGPVMAAAWSPDGRRLATAGEDHLIRIWDPTREPTGPVLYHTDGGVQAVSWTPEGRLLAGAVVDFRLRVWEWNPIMGRFPVALDGNAADVTSAAWSPDGRWLASAGTDGTIKLWDAAAWSEVATLGRQPGRVSTLLWSPDGTRLAALGTGQVLTVWDRAGGKAPVSLRQPAPGWNHAAASWRPDGSTLATLDDSEVVQIWDSRTGQNVGKWELGASLLRAMAWSPDGTKLAAGGTGQIVVILEVRADSFRVLHRLRGHTNAITALSWSPDGSRLASADEAGVKLWDPDSGHEVFRLRTYLLPARGLSWSPDGRRLALHSGQQISLWDASRGWEASRFPSPEPDGPTLPRAELLLRAEIRARRGDWDAAAADWSRVVQVQGQEGRSWFPAGWWVRGPFSAAALEAHKPESDLDPTRPPPLAGGEATPLLFPWRGVTPSTGGDLFLGPALPQARLDCAQALLRVYAAREQPVTALLNASDRPLFWLNGQSQPVVESSPGQAGRYTVLVLLQAGWNSLLIQKSLGDRGMNVLACRFSDDPADRAFALMDRGKWDQAVAVVTAVREQRPDQPATLLLAGRLFRRYAASLQEQGRADEAQVVERQARAYYEKLLTLQPDRAEYAEELAEFLLPPSLGWEVLKPTEMVSKGGALLRGRRDGAILVSGEKHWPETYTLTAETKRTGVTAIRLELLTDPSLGGQGGPGRGGNSQGNINLSEFRLTAAPASDPTKAQPVALRNAWAPHSDPNGPVAYALDGDLRTSWSIYPEMGRSHVALFEVSEALTNPGGTKLTFVLEQVGEDHQIGCFRLSVTNEPRAWRMEQLRAALTRGRVPGWTKLAAVHHMRRDWQAALAALQKATAAPGRGSGSDRLLLSLVHGQLGHWPEAQKWFVEAEASRAGRSAEPSLEHEILRHEAEAMLRDAGHLPAK